MKKILIGILAISLNLQSLAYAQADVCGMTTQEIEELNLSAGIVRLGLLEKPVTILNSPNLVKPVGDPSNSDSVVMNNQSEMYSAAEFATNEQNTAEKNSQMSSRCNNEKAIAEAKANGEFQLYAQACIVYQLVNRITSMMDEIDSLEKQMVLDKAGQNKAAAENAKREAEIKEKKEKMEKVNKEIKKGLADIKKAKEDLEKAKEEQAKAQSALDAANAITCPEDDDGSCAESKASAVAAAQKALEAAKKKVADATKKLNKAVAKMVDFLVNKMGIEVLAVMSLLSGTVKGETEGGDVHFKVGSSDYTLVNLGQVISEFTGTTAEKAKNFTDGDEVSRGTDTFFYNLVRGHEASTARDHEGWGHKGEIGNDYVNFYSTTGLVGEEAKTTVKETLDIFANMEDGADYIQTIAMAALDFNEEVTPKQIAVLEAMKTPQSRMDEMAKKGEEKNELKTKLVKMLEKSICYLDSSLTLYKGFYKDTKSEEVIKDPFYIYLNTFKTDKLKQKAKEGYHSKVDHKAIQKVLECYAKGVEKTADQNSCSALEKLPTEAAPKSCHWSGAVIGPSRPITEVCSVSNIGQVLFNESGNAQTCICQ